MRPPLTPERRYQLELMRHRPVWYNMLRRCNNPKCAAYPNYGGRGVTVCDRWDPAKGGSFENFIEDMGFKPHPKFELDKEAVDPDNKVYGPEGCRWVSRSTNCFNRRPRIPQKD